jgi:hypothetical protein
VMMVLKNFYFTKREVASSAFLFSGLRRIDII